MDDCDIKAPGPAASLVSAPSELRHPIEIRAADGADNQALLALTRDTPMAGTISLRIDRDPDFFSLLRLRGEPKVFVAARDREVLGCISAALRTAYISGNPETVAYVGDMKVRPSFWGTRVALRLIRALEAYLRSIGVDLCFSVVADGNHRAMPLFEGRLGMPQWSRFGRFLVDELVPLPLSVRPGRYRIETAGAGDLPAIAVLLDRFRRSREFAPRLAENELAPTLSPKPDDAFSRIFVARHGGRVVATLTLYDTVKVKRNVLLGAPMFLRGALALLRIATAPLPGFSVPRLGKPVRVLYARHVACEDGHRAALKPLLARARSEAFRARFTFLALGLHERDPLRSMVQGIPRFTFSSLAFATSLATRRCLEARISGIPFEDYALV